MKIKTDISYNLQTFKIHLNKHIGYGFFEVKTHALSASTELKGKWQRRRICPCWCQLIQTPFGGHCFVHKHMPCYLSWPHVQALIISDSKYITLPSARIMVLCKPIALVTYNIAGWHPKEKNNKSAGHEGQHTLSSLVHRANWSAWKLGTWSMFLNIFWNCFMFMACTKHKQTKREN